MVGDEQLVHFSIARDEAPNGSLTLLRRAQAAGFNGTVQACTPLPAITRPLAACHGCLTGALRRAADMDYPPDWMLRGVLPSFATVPPRLYPALALCAALGLPRLNSLGPAAWWNHARSPHVVLAPSRSSYFAKYVAAYAARGVRIDFLEAFNEPTDSYTRMSPQKLATFLGEHLGPTFDRLGLRPRTRLTYGGQAERWRAREVVPRLMADPKARRYMDVIACA